MKSNNFVQIGLQANLLNLYNLLYNGTSRHNHQPLSESSDSVTAKVIKEKISKINNICTSSGNLVGDQETTLVGDQVTGLVDYLATSLETNLETIWYCQVDPVPVTSATNNYLYVPQHHPYDAYDSNHTSYPQKSSDDHNDGCVITIEMT